ncbi:MAG: hemolysin III family protein [Gammaproteobacteria bacterium]|nr:hemolysin III family protein [Gammaproteobacteria bacterium]
MHQDTADPDEFNPDEWLNTLTHFLGLLLAVGGVPVLITLAALLGTGREVATFSIFGAALIFTYMSSTLYHYLQPGVLKRIMRLVDHLSIYLLIAGTYTPFLLVGLKGAWGWSLFGVLWGLAAFGILAKLGFRHRFDLLSTVAYVLMGWVGLVAIVPLVHDLPTPSLVLVLAGGVSYTVGAVFYALDKLRFNHAIWHLFCLGGSVLQFIGVFFLLGR